MPPPPQCNLQEPTRHSKFWFNDGSVVIRVKNTVFRVHRSTLCTHSEFFNGMFDIPQPETPDQFDGCPFVEMHDEVADIEAFLDVLYNPLCWDENRSDIAGIDFWLSILNVCIKYGCHVFRKKAIAVLKRHIPTEFSSFTGVDTFKIPCKTVMNVLSVARETNLRIFMPSAFAILAAYDPPDLIDAIYSMEPESVTKNLVLWRDAAISLAGRTPLISIQKHEIFKFALKFEQSPNCPKSRHRITCRIRLQNNIKENLKEDAIHDGLPGLKNTILANSKLCGTCKMHANEMFKKGYRKFWDTMPEAFGLGSWDALREEAQDFE